MRGLKLLCFFVLACAMGAVRAHPLGNSTVNRWAQLSVSGQGIEIEYVLDLAELPTLVESSSADRNADGEVTPSEWSAYSKRWAAGLVKALKVDVDRRPLALAVLEQKWERRPGEAGLSTLRLEARLLATLPELSAAVSLAYRDMTTAGSLGWKEVVLRTGDDVDVAASTLSRKDQSARLTAFPAKTDPGYPDVTSGTARLVFRAPARSDAPKAAASATLEASEPLSTAAEPRTEQPSPAALPSETMPDTSPEVVSAQHIDTRTVLLSYFRLGMHHIATGWDHLLFLFGLLLLRMELRRIVLVVTAFTLAHSLTLGVAAAGWITPPSVWIEPAIALTIAYVGFINLMKRGGHQGVWLAFGFGLIHGFGFAGALAESAATHALTGRDFLLSLASFNLGIETLQVGLVLLVVPVLAWCTRSAWYAAAQRAAAAGLALSGMGVFFARVGGTI